MGCLRGARPSWDHEGRPPRALGRVARAWGDPKEPLPRHARPGHTWRTCMLSRRAHACY
jgi:hypothetical protein